MVGRDLTKCFGESLTPRGSVLSEFLIAEDEYDSELQQSPRLAGFVLGAALRADALTYLTICS